MFYRGLFTLLCGTSFGFAFELLGLNKKTFPHTLISMPMAHMHAYQFHTSDYYLDECGKAALVVVEVADDRVHAKVERGDKVF